MLGITVYPIGPEKNLQIPQQMSDDEKDQNDPRDRDDKFFPDGRLIKAEEAVTATSPRPGAALDDSKLLVEVGVSRLLRSCASNLGVPPKPKTEPGCELRFELADFFF